MMKERILSFLKKLKSTFAEHVSISIVPKANTINNRVIVPGSQMLGEEVVLGRTVLTAEEKEILLGPVPKGGKIIHPRS